MLKLLGRKTNKKTNRKRHRNLIILVAICGVAITGCAGKQQDQSGSGKTNQTVQSTNQDSSNVERTKSVIQSSEGNSTQESQEKDTTVTSDAAVTADSTESTQASETNNNETGQKTDVVAQAGESSAIDQYVQLLGLTKDELAQKVGEEGQKIDEGGQEFANAGIRVWFSQDENKKVEQIFLMNPSIDINGAKIGDKISRYQEIFGEMISDRNGDAHFKYNDIFLSVNYDVATGDTYGVYLLQKDF